MFGPIWLAKLEIGIAICFITTSAFTAHRMFLERENFKFQKPDCEKLKEPIRLNDS